MSSNDIETNNSKDHCLAGVLDRGTLVVIRLLSLVRRKWTSQENKIIMECYLLSEPKIRGYRKHMLSLWLQKGMFWLSEHQLVDQPNTIWMTELEIEELERKVTGSDSIIVQRRQEVLRLCLIM